MGTEEQSSASSILKRINFKPLTLHRPPSIPPSVLTRSSSSTSKGEKVRSIQLPHSRSPSPEHRHEQGYPKKDSSALAATLPETSQKNKADFHRAIKQVRFSQSGRSVPPLRFASTLDNIKERVGQEHGSNRSSSTHPRADASKRLRKKKQYDSNSAVDAFRWALAEGSQRIQAVKLCFVGHARAGKTSTLRALAGQRFDPSEPSTHGVTTCSLVHDMLEAPPDLAHSHPWISLEEEEPAGGFAKLLEKGVVRAAVQEHRKHATSPEETKSSPTDEEAVITQVLAEEKAEFWLPQASPEVMKMPADLLVEALNLENSDFADSGDQDPLVLQTWDFAGQEMYYAMAHIFLTSLGIYVLALDLSAWADPWQTAEPKNEIVDSMEFWLATILIHAPDARLVIVGTHDDVIPEAEKTSVHMRVNEQLAQRLEQMPALHQRLQVNETEQLLYYPIDNSCISQKGEAGVVKLRTVLSKLALELAEDFGAIPSRWAHFFNVLSMSENCRPCVTMEDVATLAAPIGLQQEEMEPCLALFHNLGQLLHFPGSPAVVLDPQWLLDAMSHVVACPRVLQSHSHMCRALHERAELSPKLLDMLWRESQFSDYRQILLAFLEHFDLLVPAVTTSENGPVHWLVPSLLVMKEASSSTPSTIPSTTDSVVLALDFHGVLRRLVPSLLLRLLCHLQRAEGSSLRAFEVRRDAAFFAVGAGPKPIVVVLETLPTGCTPEVVRMVVWDLPSGSRGGLELKRLLENMSKAVMAWMPRLTFSTKLPCPACCKSNALGGHLLDLDAVLEGQEEFCATAQCFLEKYLPETIRFLRKSSSDAQTQHLECTPRMVAAPHEHPERLDVQYLYASPFAFRGQALEQLDIQAEVRALEGLPCIDLEVRVACAQSICEVLVPSPGPLVLHLSSHCALWPRAVLLLEDELSLGHAVAEEELAGMGPWGREGLILVFLACGSELLVRGLIDRCGLRCAICCVGQVFDAAAKLFCRAFYHALSCRNSVPASFDLARVAVRNSANPGLRGEADKFVLLGHDADSALYLESCPTHRLGIARVSSCWALWPSVEDYISRVTETAQMATYFLRRRVMLLWGEAGVGKTAFCRECCRYFSAPGGRLFSAGAFWIDADRDGCAQGEGLQDRFAKGFLEDLEVRGALANNSPSHSDEVWSRLRKALPQLDANGRWLLVVDNMPFSENSGVRANEPLASLLETLLTRSAQMRLLLVTRQPAVAASPVGKRWAKLADAKVCHLQLEPLPPRVAAKLFALQVRRPFYPCDFDLEAPGPEGRSPLRLERGESTYPGSTTGLLERLAAAPLLHVLGGNPRRIVEAAAIVDDALSSLLMHPALPASWKRQRGRGLHLENEGDESSVAAALAQQA